MTTTRSSFALAAVCALFAVQPAVAQTRAGDALPPAGIMIAQSVAGSPIAELPNGNSCARFDFGTPDLPAGEDMYQKDQFGDWILDSAGNLVGCEPPAAAVNVPSAAVTGVTLSPGLIAAIAGFVAFTVSQLAATDSPG